MNKAIYRVICCVLKPLVVILHRQSIAFEEFSQIARKIYVEVAEEKLLAAGERPSNSRISVTTGLTRRDVAQLRKLPAEDLLASAHINRGVRVINGWMTDHEFLARDGQPALLPVQGKDKDDVGSFAALVHRYSGDVPFKAMLKELCLNGVVDMTGDKKGRVRLLNAAYIPRESDEESLLLMGQDIAELIKTIDHNHQTEPDKAYYQRKVCYDNLPEASVKQFRQMAKEDGQALLVKFNQWLIQHDRDSHLTPVAQDSEPMRIRAGVGIYYFEEQMAKDKK